MPSSSAFRIRCRVDLPRPGADRLLVGAGERQAHPVAGRLDLLDRMEADRRQPGGVAGVGGDLGIGRHDGHALLREVIDEGAEPLRDLLGRLPGRDRAARDVRRPAADDRQRPAQDEDRGAVLVDQLIRLPAGAAAVLGPGGGLEDVAADDVDGPLVPIAQLLWRCRSERRQAASPPV